MCPYVCVSIRSGVATFHCPQRKDRINNSLCYNVLSIDKCESCTILMFCEFVVHISCICSLVLCTYVRTSLTDHSLSTYCTQCVPTVRQITLPPTMVWRVARSPVASLVTGTTSSSGSSCQCGVCTRCCRRPGRCRCSTRREQQRWGCSGS